MGARTWNEEEIALLRLLYPLYGPHGVHLVLPHRSVDAITVRAHRLGVVTVAPRGPRPRYADSLIASVYVECKGIASAAAERLGVSITTIYVAVARCWRAEAGNGEIAA